jgi:hypothetical protein
MNNTKKPVAKSSTGGKIKLTQDETLAAPPVQSGVRAGASFRSFSPVSFAPVSFAPISFAPVVKT